jgi:hypothetical protein
VAPSGERPVSASGAKLFKIAFDLDAERADGAPVSAERLWGVTSAPRPHSTVSTSSNNALRRAVRHS